MTPSSAAPTTTTLSPSVDVSTNLSSTGPGTSILSSSVDARYALNDSSAVTVVHLLNHHQHRPSDNVVHIRPNEVSKPDLNIPGQV